MHYIFGSWFDPFTHGHEEIIKTVKKKMRAGDKLHILVTDNDEKTNRTPVEFRKQMVTAALASKNVNYDIDIQTNRMHEYLWVKYRQYDPKDITIVMGDDEWRSLVAGKWLYSNRLLTTYNFLVFARGTEEIAYKQANCTVVNNVKNWDVSSSAVREIFRTNPDCHYKDVQKYISKVVFNVIKHEGTLSAKNEIISTCLYNQNPTNYVDLEKKWVENYKKQGWGAFANTVDICAISGDEVLLIRRKKPPFMGHWCTPGGFFNHSAFKNKETGLMEKPDADLEHAAQREFREEAGLNIPVEKFSQIKTYSHMFDPRLRIIDTAFVVHVPGKDKKKAIAGDDAADVGWFKLDNLPKLGFHHGTIIEDALKQ